jgi:hypothetical protein
VASEPRAHHPSSILPPPTLPFSHTHERARAHAQSNNPPSFRQVTYTSSRGIRSLGPSCLAYGSACVVSTAGGLQTEAPYRFALPAPSVALPPLFLWIQLSSAADADVFLCQEPTGGPGSKCSAYAMPPYQPRKSTTGYDAVVSVRGGSATAMLLLPSPDVTGSGRPYFRAFVSIGLSPASLPFEPNTTADGRYVDVPRAAGVPYSLIVAAGPTLLFVPPLLHSSSGVPAISVSPDFTSVDVLLQPCGHSWTTDPAFPSPSLPAQSYSITAVAFLPEWLDNATTIPGGQSGAASLVLSTAPGVRLALDRTRFFGSSPSAIIPASASATGDVTLSINDLQICTTYRLAVIARCGAEGGCLPYAGVPQEVAFPAAINFTTLCAPLPPPPTPHKRPTLPPAVVAGIAIAVLVAVAAGASAAWWCYCHRVVRSKPHSLDLDRNGIEYASLSGGRLLAGVSASVQ